MMAMMVMVPLTAVKGAAAVCPAFRVIIYFVGVIAHFSKKLGSLHSRDPIPHVRVMNYYHA